MFKMFLKVIKWFALFWVCLLVSGILTGIIGGLLAGLLGLEINIGVMLTGFTAIFMAEAALRIRRKRKAKTARTEAVRAAREAEAEKNRLKDESAVRLDAYRVVLERQARKIKHGATAAQVKHIAVLLHQIAAEVEQDPRDRSRVRGLCDHSGGMICDLVDKYIKLESQNQTGGAIGDAMHDIRSALQTVEVSLKTLLEDLFRNDVEEVSANISVLENILGEINPENRIRMEDVARAIQEMEAAAAAGRPAEAAVKEEGEVKPLESV